MASLLANAPFEQTTLTYQAPDGTTTTDAYGNPVPGSTSGTLKALLAPFKADQLQRLEGADVTTIRVRGELIDPLAFPSGVGVGSQLTLTYAGKSWTLTLTSIIPNDLPGVAFGSYFEGDMGVT